MFERFTRDARDAVVHAQEVVRRVGDDHIGSEHVLLGAAEVEGSVAARALRRLGIETAALEAAVRALPGDALDAEALAGVGIDLAEVRRRAEETFGPGAFDAAAPRRRRGRTPGHVPFDRHAKKVLEISLREAIRLKQNHIDTGHMLLAVVRLTETPAHGVLVGLGATPDLVRTAVVETWAEAPAA